MQECQVQTDFACQNINGGGSADDRQPREPSQLHRAMRVSESDLSVSVCEVTSTARGDFGVWAYKPICRRRALSAAIRRVFTNAAPRFVERNVYSWINSPSRRDTSIRYPIPAGIRHSRHGYKEHQAATAGNNSHA